MFSFFCCEYCIFNFSPSLWLANETNHKTSSCLELMAVFFIFQKKYYYYWIFFGAMDAKGPANKTKEKLASSKSCTNSMRSSKANYVI